MWTSLPEIVLYWKNLRLVSNEIKSGKTSQCEATVADGEADKMAKFLHLQQYQIDTNDVQLEKTCVFKRPTPKVLDPASRYTFDRCKNSLLSSDVKLSSGGEGRVSLRG
ncbi:hypothetical protein K0M31_009769 [Melipona bicolor]|uniref:Uncharacterized protein n=1 Tax=Melipona bicolor TaxID=60889 RepID=A0AA40KIR9_9HYME|nr:hypothetical protein K0M31_009769 [Melipona bicolor]